MTRNTIQTLGRWTHNDSRELTASYVDRETVRVERNDGTASELLTEEKWLALFDLIRDNGFKRTGSCTADMWEATHSALMCGRWNDGRALLDDLGLCDDNQDELLDAVAYRVPRMIRELIQDRIDLVNAKARSAFRRAS